MKLPDIIRERYGDPERFIEEIRGQMRLHRITQGQLAARLGCSRSHVSRWFTTNPHSRARPSLEARVQIDEALDQLISGDL
jgi:transcriptional regulator with XRE-family HTH domain